MLLWLRRRASRCYVVVLRFFLAPVVNDVDYLYRSLDRIEDDIESLQNDKADQSDVDDLDRLVRDLEDAIEATDGD